MYVYRHAKNNHFPIDFVIFTKALRTNGPTDGPTYRRTDRPSYRDAIAASKKRERMEERQGGTLDPFH